ncbi:DUF6883 domain-containing protein [Salisaeta longa]|uniref:DUF6883 domain-containing protein n=1 Tax=Salisaeta longa TaxID=503170 RepID=UPI0004904C6A
MRLPNRYKAYVPREKLSGDLLSRSHAVGKSKARFFRAHGYDEETADHLARDRLNVAHQNEVVEVAESPHDATYVVEGTLRTPRGTTVSVRTVWIVASEDAPRFVTAYPR